MSDNNFDDSNDQSEGYMAQEETAQDEEALRNPYGYAEQGCTFGVRRKGMYYPKSNFCLRLLYFVNAQKFTGYVCEISREMDEVTKFVLLATYSYKLYYIYYI